MNQSRTIGSVWILWRFAVLPLGSSSTGAAAGAAGAAQGVLVQAVSLVCERSGDRVSWVPPARLL